jgi:hypothetical protein
MPGARPFAGTTVKGGATSTPRPEAVAFFAPNCPPLLCQDLDVCRRLAAAG